MELSPVMQKAITAIAAKHGIDLAEIGASLTLYQDGYQRLAIECIGKHQVSVAHYYEVNGDLVQDPDVVFFTAYGSWIPFQFQNGIVFRDYVTISDDGNRITHMNIKAQADLAGFTEMWGQNIIDQNWLERGAPKDSSDVVIMHVHLSENDQRKAA